MVSVLGYRSYWDGSTYLLIAYDVLDQSFIFRGLEPLSGNFAQEPANALGVLQVGHIVPHLLVKTVEMVLHNLEWYRWCQYFYKHRQERGLSGQSIDFDSGGSQFETIYHVYLSTQKWVLLIYSHIRAAAAGTYF